MPYTDRGPDTENFGTSKKRVQSSTDDGSPWCTSWDFGFDFGSSTCQIDDCGHNARPNAMQTWDTRNAN